MRVADIPSERLNLLNTGQAESTTLTECLSVDFAALMRATFPDIGQERLSAMQAASGAGITRRMALAAKLIHDAYPQGVVATLCQHKSDTLRGWACYLIAEQEDMPLRTRLMSMRCLADDAHFGVREWAWLAVRPYIAADLDDAISELSVWALDPSERIRRFRIRGHSSSRCVVRAPYPVTSTPRAGSVGFRAPASGPCGLRTGFRGKLAQRCQQGSAGMGAISM